MEQAAPRPVPAPRRLYPELRAANYENIELNLPHSSKSQCQSNNNNNCNKLNIESKNLHQSCSEKSAHQKLIQNVVLEQQPIYGPDANENVPQEPLYATPKPAPRQRLPPEEISSPNLRLRKAPEVPAKPLNIELERRRADRYSISSEFSTTSVDVGAGNGDLESQYTPSSGSLNSLSGKFNTQSPGYVVDVDSDAEQQVFDDHDQVEVPDQVPSDIEADDSNADADNNLLRSLGSTSKQLGEAIGERVAFKAKDAKRRLDKNLKSSSEALSNLRQAAGKRFGSNFTLTKRDKDKVQTREPMQRGEHAQLMERPMTMPNTDVFKGIQFSSPLQRLERQQDLSCSQEQAHSAESETNYEVPQQSKPAKPPSYDEALRARPLETASSDSTGEELPMPNFPAPRLSQQLDALQVQAQAPARVKRRKHYEHIQLRRQLDSAQLQQLNLEAADAERLQSLQLSASNAAAEATTPQPARSDSWEFQATGVDEQQQQQQELEDELDSSAEEPLYANQEATYGKLFESRSKLLTPQLELACISEDAELEGAVGGLPLELIEEFDPLSSKCSTLARSNKSNELLLLEHLLEEDTYGSIKREQDDVSMCTSEEEATRLTQAAQEEQEQDKTEVKQQLEQEEAAQVVDLARNRTNWFVNDAKTPIEGDSPPTYLEAIGEPIGAAAAAAAVPPTAAAAAAAESRNTLSSRLRQTMNAFSNVKLRMDAMKRRASFKARQSEVKHTLQMVPRPTLSPCLVRYEGPLVRFPSGVVEDILKEMQNRKAILRDRQFQTFLDQEMKTPKEFIPLDAITTLQCVSNSRVTDSATHFYCFELTTSQPKHGACSSAASADSMSSNPNLLLTSSASGNCKQQRVAHLYGVNKESERGVWMQKILESLTNSLPLKYTCHYYRAGWCYLKTSITSEWSGTWLVLRKSQRRLIFVSESNGNVEKMDLRKARCIVLKESDESIDNLHVESGPMLMIDCPPYAVYMVMSSTRETKIWRHIIREVAHNNGFSLGEQQLTRYDVPVIVDKCINFVYIHGSMSEGIYRKSGSENSIQKLMSAFRADAFNVEITRNEYNEHDVANVLKRFMRDLPERLLGKLTDSFVFVTELAVATEKIPIYKELLARLSTIEHETLRRIVGHLVFISSQQSKNKMSVQNLTMIWGPTLLAKKSDELIYSQKEADVLSDLILLYKNLFPCSVDEMKKEQAMLSCLQKYYAAAETLKDAVKQSGDIKIWISLNPNPENTTEEKTQVNATISPTKSAYELCREYAAKMGLATHQLTLYEVILNGSLERPLHHDTKVFDVILNWSYWPEEDRKHNYLMVRPLELLREVQRAVKNLATVTPGKELRFADYRTKSFKSLQCELRDGKIVISKKDKNDKTTIVREIFLHSSTAYLGCERKRDFPWSWAITFVERTQAQIMRSRDAPYIGHVLAGSEWMDRTIWYSSIWYCLHGDNILPPAEIIIK